MAAVTATHIGNFVGKRLLDADRNQVRRIKTVMVTTTVAADSGAELDITLANYGLSATGLLAVRGVSHTTTNSVIVIESFTTSVTSGVLTVTLTSPTNDDIRAVFLVGEEA